MNPNILSAEISSPPFFPQAVIANRYRVLDLLGQGGMGCVYRVWDQEAQKERALKVLFHGQCSFSSKDDGSKEFLALCQFRHPHIVSVYDFGYTSQQQPFFTMEYIQGDTLLAYIGSPEKQVLHTLCGEIMQALSAIHDQGMLHADLKPANILIDTRTHRPQARLADFGLAAHVKEFNTQIIRGTVPYLAPERILREAPDIRSDLYALGVLLYHLLAGELPFDGPTQTILQRHLYEQPLPPSRLEPTIPPHWDEVILRLLAKDPELRYASVNDVMEAWEGTITPTLIASQGSFYCNQDIGRTKETAQFQEHFNNLPTQGQWLGLTGPMGIGKSHLLNRWRIEAQLQKGHWIQREPQPNVPFSPLTEIFEALALRNPDDAALQQLATWLRNPSQPTSHAQGQNRQAQVYSPAEAHEAPQQPQQTTPQEARQRLFQKLVELFRQVSFRHPSVLVLDALEQASEDTHQLLQQLAIHCSDGAVLWIVSGQLEGCDWLTPLHAALGEHFHHFALDALTVEEMHQLLQQMLGDVEGLESLTQQLLRHSNGNPLLLEELLWHYHHHDVLRRSQGSWRFDPAMARCLEMDSPQQILHSLLSHKLSLCSSEEQNFLTAIAMWEGPISQEWLQRLMLAPAASSEVSHSTQPPSAMIRILTALQQKRLCAVQKSHTTVTFVLTPPQLGEYIRSQLSTEETRDWHDRIYRMLCEAQRQGQIVSDVQVARHALATGRWLRVQELLPRVEQTLVNTQAYALGHQFFHALSLHLSQQQEHLEAAKAHKKAAQFARYLARFDDVRLSLQAACDALTSLLPREESSPPGFCLATRQPHRGGDQEAGTLQGEAILCWAEVLREIGREDNRTGKYESAVQSFQQALEMLQTLPHTLLLQVSLWRILGWSYMMLGQYQKAQEACERALTLLSPTQDSVLRCQVHRLRAAIAFYQGQPQVVEDAGHTALQIAQQFDDPRGQAEAYFSLGNLANLQSRYNDAIYFFTQAYELFEKLDLLGAMGRCRNNLGVASYLVGDWSQAIQHWEYFAAICQRRNDRSQQVNALNNFGFLYKDRGSFQQARRTLEQALQIAQEDGMERLEATLHGNLGEALWRMGEHLAAADHIDQAISIAQRLGAEHEVIENQRRLITMDIEDGAWIPAETALLNLQEKLHQTPCAQEEAHIQMLWGQMWLRRGQPEKAETPLRNAAERFSQQNAMFEEARCWTLQAQVAREMGNVTEARELAERARKRFQTLGAGWDLQQLESFFPSASRQHAHTPLSAGISPDVGIKSYISSMHDNQEPTQPPSFRSRNTRASEPTVKV